jgi:hypothetical protein
MDKMMDDDYILNFEDKHQNEPGCNENDENAPKTY